jgi:phosphoribosylformylglycinamidine synthase PurS subunit
MPGVLARVYVTPKRGILDPQGKAVHHALHALGFAEVQDVRVGKYVELKLTGSSADAARTRVREMCERLLANGVIEDFRVELGEVQQLLSEVPGVLEAAAILVDGVLMGFVRATGDLGDVRALLPPGAPAYLVPQAVHRVAELPRTATGKLDRAALAARTRGPAADVRIPDSLPPTSSGPAGVAPDSSPLAALLVAVRTVTGLPAAAERPFTAVGDSLAAMRVCTRLYTRGWTLDPTVLLDGRRLAEAAAHAHRRPADQPARAAEPGPLSPNQSGIWFAENLAPGSTSFLVPLRLRLDGVPDPDRLRAALTEVVRRHPVLDCRIDRRAGRPVLTRMDEAPWLDQVAVGSAEEADDLAAAEAAEPIDLHHEPPLRATLVQLPRDRSELLLTLHHIAFDGWSGDLLLRDLCEAYRGTPDRPRPADFLTYAARQAATAAAGGFAAEASLVAEQLRGLPTRLSLRERDDRTPALRAEGSVLDVDPALRRGLTELAHARHTTLFVTLLSGFAEGLAQVTGQRRLIIGTVTANRPHLDLEEVIGLFTNIVPIGLDLDAGGARHGSDLIGHVRDRLLAAMRHARVPFSAVVSAAAPERTPGHAPLVQVLFEYFGEPRTRYDLDGIAMTVSGDGLQQGAVADFSLRVFPYDAGLRCVAVRDASVVAEHVATAVLSATTDAWRRMVARRIA